MFELPHEQPFTVRCYEAGPSRLVRPAAGRYPGVGDTALVRCLPEAGAGPGRVRHEIVRQKDGRELARLRVSWV